MGEGTRRYHSGEQIELQAKLLNYFLGSNKSNINQSTLGWGDRRGAHGTFPYPSRDGGEGWEEAVHMPTGVTYVTEKHFFLVKGTLTHLALCIIRGRASRAGDEGQYGPERG